MTPTHSADAERTSTDPADATYNTEPLCARLASLNQAIGEEFLSLGALVQKVAQQGCRVASLARNAADMAASAESQQDSEMLTGILRDEQTLEQLAESSHGRLEHVSTVIKTSLPAVAALERIPPLLTTLGTLTRIESGRLRGDADTGELAANVTELARSVTLNVVRISSETRTLLQLVSEREHRLGNISGTERDQARALMRQTREVLEAMQLRADASIRAMAQIEPRYANIRAAVEKMVIALQAQDIARQRCEHVQDVVARLSPAVTTGASDARAVLQLQASQVAGTRDYLRHALEDLAASMRCVRGELQELTAQTREAVAQAGDNGVSVATAIDDGVKRISLATQRHAASVRDILAVVKTIVPSLASISHAVRELKQVEQAIHRTALNARIETSHLGENGAALRALASELQIVTQESKTHIENYLQNISAIEDDMRALSAGEMGADAVTASAENATAQMQRLHAHVIYTNSVTGARLEELVEGADVLGADLQCGATIAHNASKLCAAFDDLERALRDAAATMEPTSGPVDADAAGKAHELAALYSMQSERDLHHEVFGAGPGTLVPPPADQLGDGIELF